MKQISAAMFLTAALSLGVSAFAQTTPTNPTGQVDPPTGQAAPQKPADLKDVPAGHWAQEAIKIAADCGIIRGYPDGTFRGNQPITRYEAAAIVARLIAMIKSGACGVGVSGSSGFMITEEQYNNLMSAVQELQADLAQLGVRVAELEDNAVTQDDLARVEELATQARDIAEQAASTADDAAAAAADAADAAAAAQEAADAAQASADENADAIQAAQDAAAAAQEAADAAQASADENADAIQAAQDAADAAQEAADAAQASADDALDFIGTITVSDGGDASVNLDTLATVDDVAALQDQIDALQETIDGMEPTAEFDPTELQGQLDDLTGTVDDLQSQIDDLNAQIAEGTVTTPEGEVFDPTDLQDQIDDLQAQIADTQDQISALTDAVNAQQETVDGLVDAVAGTQDDIGTLQDVTADLQAQIDALGTETGDPQAVQDLMDAIDAASIAADTALAQSRELQDKVDELDGRVTDLESGLGELGATVESQADSIAALNDLVVLLNQDVLSLQDRVTQLERQVDDLTNAPQVDPAPDLTDDLDSLREFTTLLRRDQTALADTVGDLEARVGALETKVDTGLAALDKRVTALENNGFTISGTIRLDYYTSRLWFANGKGLAPDFDIDRLGFTTYFTSGDIVDSKNDGDSPTFYGDFNFDYIQAYGADSQAGAAAGYVVNATNSGASTYQLEGTVYPGLSLVFGFKARPLTEASGAFNTFSIKLTLTLDKKSPFTNPQGFGQDNAVTLGTFKITGLASQFKVGGAPLFINFGINPAFKFTNYGFNNGGGRGSGFVATADGAGLLPLNPTLTVVYGSTGGVNNDNGDSVSPPPFGTDFDDRYHVGLYGTLSLIPGLTGGVYYGYEGTDVIANFVYNNTVYGLGFSGKVFGFLGLEGEWNVSKLNSLANAQVATYAKASLALDPFTIGANFRYIDPQFSGIGTSNSPYKPNQKGFGANAGLANLFGFLSLSAYFDSYSRVDNTAGALPDNSGGAATNSRTTFGVKLGFRLIGFDITGYIDRVNELNNSGVPATGTTYDRTKAGVDLKHDGSKSDALIGGLNLALGYNSEFDGVGGAAAASTFTRLYAYADLSLKFGDFKVTPRGWFNTKNQGNGGTTTDLGGRLDIDAPFLFGSKLALGGAIDQTTQNAAAGGVNSSTTWLKAGLAWDSFLLPNSSFSTYIGLRNDTNRNGRGFGPSFGSPYGSWGDQVASTSTSLLGLYFEFSYYGLGFYYGIFQLTNTPGLIGGDPVRFGQAFAISYALKF